MPCNVKAGDIISHYELLEELGRGGMGVVFAARDIKLWRKVAIKFLPRHLTSDPDARIRFEQEARAASALDHKNICTVYEIGEDEGHVYIAMGFYDGETLNHTIERGPLDLERGLHVVRQIVSGLSAAHSAGIVHRDVKPANILLTTSDQVKLLDFGLAKHSDIELTVSGATVGTMAYMSPEQVRGESAEMPSDIWSFGVVMFELLTGKRPFEGDFDYAVQYSILNEEPREIDRIDREFGADIGAVVRACLDKDPAARPTVQEVADALNPHEEASTIRTKRVVGRRSARSRLLYVGLGVAAVVLAIALFRLVDAPGKTLSLSSVAVLPVTTEDSTLKVTLDGLLETASRAVADVVETTGAVRQMVPFSDVVEQNVSSAREARGKLGADFSVASRVSGYDPVPTLEFSLLRGDDDEVLETINVPILIDDLEQSYEATVRRVGLLLGLVDTALVQHPDLAGTTTPEVFRLYTRAMGLLQQRASIRSLRAAEELLIEAVEADPEFPQGHAALGLTDYYLFETTRDISLLEKAERHCDTALRYDGNLTDAYVTLGWIHVNTGSLGQARGALETALQQEPFNMRALLALASVFEALHENEQAEATYNEAIRSRPEYWGGYNRLGRFYSKMADYQAAAEQFQTVLELAPMNALGYRNLGTMYYFLGRYEDAETNWRESLDITPHYTTYNNLGSLNFYLGDYPEAAAAYEQALGVNENDHNIWGSLGEAYYLMNVDSRRYTDAWARAAEMAEQWLEVNPLDQMTKARLASYYADLGETEKSQNLVEEFGPAPSEEVSGAVGFQIATTWETLGFRDRALSWIEDALAKGYAVDEVMRYPRIAELRADRAFVRILDSLRAR